jgi:hypothetical protein
MGTAGGCIRIKSAKSVTGRTQSLGGSCKCIKKVSSKMRKKAYGMDGEILFITNLPFLG